MNDDPEAGVSEDVDPESGLVEVYVAELCEKTSDSVVSVREAVLAIKVDEEELNPDPALRESGPGMVDVEELGLDDGVSVESCPEGTLRVEDVAEEERIGKVLTWDGITEGGVTEDDITDDSTSPLESAKDE